MTVSLPNPRVRAVVERLFTAAELDDDLPSPRLTPHAPAWARATSEERAEALADHYIPISAPGGALLYALARAIRPDTVVEFGTSYAISTLFLASAVADNGAGHVFTTEISPRKIAAATANLAEAGLAERVTILSGDALETLERVDGPIGLLLLDGWKDLCLPVLRRLEPRLADGAIVIADDVDQASMADYLRYVREPANGYVSVAFPVEDGMELSAWVGHGAAAPA